MPPTEKPPASDSRSPGWSIVRLIVSRLLSFKILLSIATLIIACRTPGSQLVDLARVLFRTGEKDTGLSTVGWIVASAGWILAIVFLGVFIYMSRRTDRLYKAELDRVSTERNKLQEQLTGESVAHSRKRKT